MAEPDTRRTSVRTFEDLEIWKAARALSRAVYETTSGGGFRGDHGLRNQIRRAAVSVPSNIAEGFERDGSREFLQFLAQAKGSCGEVRSDLYIALDQKYLSPESFESLRRSAIRISRMISNLMKYLRTSEVRGKKFKASPDA